MQNSSKNKKNIDSSSESINNKALKKNAEQVRLDALAMHSSHPKGKLGIYISKQLNNQHDLSLAYSPGVAYPCQEIHKDPSKALEYTAKGNFVAIISNGTAVLGLGNLGALASKPVMEGKAVLFKKFAGVDAIDIEVDTEDPEAFVNAVRYLGPAYSGINLEDIKAPECFNIEKQLKEYMDIPVFHDDQHGTAVVVLAGLINALHITKRNFADVKIVINGAGAAAIACAELIKKAGAKNIILCDTKGVIFTDRVDNMNQWKENHAIKTNFRTLKEAIVGADVFLGLSIKGALTGAMVHSMNDNPIIFAMANPDPEITPDEVHAIRNDAIVATGRSDYHNQINNVMCFPYMFRGAIDVQAHTINDEMKMAAANAIAMLAREASGVSDKAKAACSGRKMTYGPEYIIPVLFDSRLIVEVSSAVAYAAINSGVHRKTIEDFELYKRQLANLLNPAAILTNTFLEHATLNPKTMIFAEGEEEQMIKAAVQWKNDKCGKAILVGHIEPIQKILKEKFQIEYNDPDITVTNASIHQSTELYIDSFYKKCQRAGLMRRDCIRLINRDRNVFSAAMLEHGDADCMITGLTRSYNNSIQEISQIIDVKKDKLLFALSILIKRGKILFLADTAVNETPSATELVEIAIGAANEVEKMGYTPRVAFVSHSNFSHASCEGLKDVTHKNITTNSKHTKKCAIKEAMEIMLTKNVNFEYDGEMSVDVALNHDLIQTYYSFSKLTDSANILIMRGLHSASASAKILKEFGKATLIGPILCGFTKPVQIVEIGSDSDDVFNAAIIASRIG